MFGIQENMSFAFLMNSKVLQIQNLDSGGFRIHLHPARTIDVEGGYRLDSLYNPQIRPPLLALQGCQIVSAKTKSKSELEIIFDAGLRLLLYDDHPDRECIQILPDAIII